MRVTSLDWLPAEYAARDCRPGSGQIVVLYRKQRDHSECYLEYSTSNPDYAAANALTGAFDEFAILVDL